MINIFDRDRLPGLVLGLMELWSPGFESNVFFVVHSSPVPWTFVVSAAAMRLGIVAGRRTTRSRNSLNCSRSPAPSPCNSTRHRSSDWRARISDSAAFSRERECSTRRRMGSVSTMIPHWIPMGLRGMGGFFDHLIIVPFANSKESRVFVISITQGPCRSGFLGPNNHPFHPPPELAREVEWWSRGWNRAMMWFRMMNTPHHSEIPCENENVSHVILFESVHDAGIFRYNFAIRSNAQLLRVAFRTSWLSRAPFGWDHFSKDWLKLAHVKNKNYSPEKWLLNSHVHLRF